MLDEMREAALDVFYMHLTRFFTLCPLSCCLLTGPASGSAVAVYRGEFTTGNLDPVHETVHSCKGFR